MSTQKNNMKPQDIVILFKIISLGELPWTQVTLAESLFMSQSEISQSLVRSKYSGLLDPSGKKVRRMALMEFLQHGIRYVFPQQPGSIVRGFATAHSALPLSTYIKSEEPYVWPTGRGAERGQSIAPLYPSVIKAAQADARLYHLLTLVDALRVGKAREIELAVEMLQKRILHGE